MTDFIVRLRVRYGECDAQGIVFNARWGDYVDVATTEYTRALFGGGLDNEIDMRLVKQTTEWHAPARYDDILDVAVRTVRVGTTSFTLGTRFSRDTVHLADSETVYVVIDLQAGTKRAIPDRYRSGLERGAPNIVIDQSGQTGGVR